MRLLLDEMHPPIIAEELRRRGYEAVAVAAMPELRMLADPDIFAAAQEERRAVVTENIADFLRIADSHDQTGREHHGLVLIDPGRYPRGSPGTIGRLVKALDALLAEHPGEDPTSLRHWV